VLRFRRRAAGWGAFTFSFVGIRGRKVARSPLPPPPTQKGGEEEKGFGDFRKLPFVLCGVIKKQGEPLAFLLSRSCGYTAALRRLERLTDIEEENNIGQRWLGRNVAPKILVKFNNYNSNL
jgi:hypothetical protein